MIEWEEMARVNTRDSIIHFADVYGLSLIVSYPGWQIYSPHAEDWIEEIGLRHKLVHSIGADRSKRARGSVCNDHPQFPSKSKWLPIATRECEMCLFDYVLPLYTRNSSRKKTPSDLGLVPGFSGYGSSGFTVYYDYQEWTLPELVCPLLSVPPLNAPRPGEHYCPEPQRILINSWGPASSPWRRGDLEGTTERAMWGTFKPVMLWLVGDEWFWEACPEYMCANELELKLLSRAGMLPRYRAVFGDLIRPEWWTTDNPSAALREKHQPGLHATLTYEGVIVEPGTRAYDAVKEWVGARR